MHPLKGEKPVKKTYQIVITSLIVISVVLLSAICWHSIEEIHYLKSFFPKHFTVQEAMYASIVELIKTVILSIPFLLVVCIGLFLIRESHKRS
jgi:hypothetical protein